MALLLAACAASPVRNQVTVYHEWPDTLSARTFRMAPAPEGEQTLAWRTFRNIVRQHFEAHGFRQTPDPALEVSFSYQETRQNGEVVEQVPAVTSHLSIGGHWSHGGLSVGFPVWWGGWPYYSVSRPVTFYERRLTIEISDLRGGEPRRVYEATARNRGDEPAAAAALGHLVDAILDDFPGRSGVVRQVSVQPVRAQ